MVNLPLVTAVIIAVGAPFFSGFIAVDRDEASSQGDADAGNSVYRRGFQAAKVPALGFFLPLALGGIYFQLFVLGYGGGPPPTTIIVLQMVGSLVFLVVFIGGLTAAGAVLAVHVLTE